MLGKAREIATVLASYIDPTACQINLQAIVAATSTKVRTAYLGLPALVERHLVIRQALAVNVDTSTRVADRDGQGTDQCRNVTRPGETLCTPMSRQALRRTQRDSGMAAASGSIPTLAGGSVLLKPPATAWRSPWRSQCTS